MARRACNPPYLVPPLLTTPKTHEVIGTPPNVSVPTHFAKVVLAAKPTAPDVYELSTGAFVLPNAPIPDEAPLEGFVMPGEPLELNTGRILFLFCMCPV
jgi:endonuclease G, mitochondrial